MAYIKVGTATTDANGNITFEGLPYGSYKIEQKTTKTGYTATSGQSDAIVIDNTTPDIELDLSNSPTETGTMTVFKHVEDYEDWGLAGGKFKLMDNDGKTMVSESSATDANGNITFANLMSVTGTPATYKIVEVVAPSGYEINTDEKSVTVTVGAVSTEPVPNTPTVSGSLEIDLTDTNYNEYGLNGADYDLYVDM